MARDMFFFSVFLYRDFKISSQVASLENITLDCLRLLNLLMYLLNDIALTMRSTKI